ncbi:MAG: phosphopantetheine-binding protein [Candidatus Caldatribacteriota bacterium]|nr:phosphopantetheine-binding protein [Candidatus Caldatribacteriota bacterium]
MMNTESYIEKRRSLTILLKKRIIEMLQLPLEEDKIDLDCPLFGSGLGLDSVDAVGLAAMIESDFNVRVFDSDISMFRSINSIVDFILQRKAEISAGKEPEEIFEGTVAENIEIEINSDSDEKTQMDLKDYITLRYNVGLVELFSSTVICIEGPDAELFVDFIVAGDIADLAVDSLLNSLILKNNGTISSIVWIARQDTAYLLISDKKERQSLISCLNLYRGTRNVEIIDKSEETEILAVIGPKAQDLVVDLFEEDLLRLGYGEFEVLEWKGTEIMIGRYGETGEFDYRFIVPAEISASLAEEITDSGSIYQLRRCSPDLLRTLMMEMKSIHQDSMLLTNCFPHQVDLQWMVDFNKESFLGHEALTESHNKGYRKAVLLTADAVSVEQMGDQVWLDRLHVGFVQSSAYSFALGKWILFAFIDFRYAWPNQQFIIKGKNTQNLEAVSKSAPLFLTRTILESLNI